MKKNASMVTLCFLMACSGGEDTSAEVTAAADQLQEALDQAQAQAAQAAAEPAEPVAADPAGEAPAGARYTCNQPTNHLCYQTTPLSFTIPGEQSGCEGMGGTGTWTEGGECPTEGVIGTCQKERNNETRYFYEGVTAELAEGACTAFGGTFTASE